MGLEVIGAGFGRTGTLSLRAALEQLGFGPCYHMLELRENPRHAKLWDRAGRGKRVDWRDLFDHYRATVDWPGAYFWADLRAAYPEAKVVLTVRDPGRWYDSASQTIFRSARRGALARASLLLATALRPGRRRTTRMMRNTIYQGTFDGRIGERDYALAVFERHVDDVTRRVPPERLLVYDVADGWGPLCRFLGVEVPAMPFPHLNDAASFQRMIRGRFRRRLVADALPAAGLLAGITLVGYWLRRIRK